MGQHCPDLGTYVAHIWHTSQGKAGTRGYKRYTWDLGALPWRSALGEPLGLVPPSRIELLSSVPETDALSFKLRGRLDEEWKRAPILSNGLGSCQFCRIRNQDSGLGLRAVSRRVESPEEATGSNSNSAARDSPCSAGTWTSPKGTCRASTKTRSTTGPTVV